jgi:hypothetical protein
LTQSVNKKHKQLLISVGLSKYIHRKQPLFRILLVCRKTHCRVDLPYFFVIRFIGRHLNFQTVGRNRPVSRSQSTSIKLPMLLGSMHDGFKRWPGHQSAELRYADDDEPRISTF